VSRWEISGYRVLCTGALPRSGINLADGHRTPPTAQNMGYSQRVQLEAGEPAGAATTRLLSCCLCDHCRSRFRWDKGLDVKDALHFLGRRFRF